MKTMAGGAGSNPLVQAVPQFRLAAIVAAQHHAVAVAALQFALPHLQYLDEARKRELTPRRVGQNVAPRSARRPTGLPSAAASLFMFQGVVELCQMAYQSKLQSRALSITIPTNSILSTIPSDKVPRIAESCPKSRLIINLSLDGIGEKHDHIRGVPGNFKKSSEERSSSEAVGAAAQSLPNLTLGIHSVVSTFSVGHLDEIMEYADQSGVDQFITEIAEPRVELDTVGSLPITARIKRVLYESD